MWSKPKELPVKEEENDLLPIEEEAPSEKAVPSTEEEVQGVDSQEEIPDGDEDKYGIQMDSRSQEANTVIETQDFNLRKARVTRPNRKV